MFKPTEAPKNQARHHNMSSKGSREPKAIHIEEEVKIAVKLALDRFCYSNEKELEFPSSFSSTERAFVHRLAQSLGYSSRSKGKGSSRFLTVRKKETSDKLQPSICLDLSSSSAYFIRSLLQRFPPSKKERVDLHPNAKSGNPLATESNGSFDRTRASGRLNNGIPMVPKKRTPSVLDAFRRSLPVVEHQDEIVQLIRDHRVVLVLGETGSGKTTQIPQFLLDDCSRYGKPCRIFCTQPRRLATIAVAERVAAERGESVGQTVGYHIRLESRVSPKTLLTFCTSGVLLRTLMAGDGSLTTVTHVIVDEVHERDGLTDFLLTKLRDVLLKVPTLKLILSSAALDIDLFLQYFGSCPVIRLRGKQFEVKQFFLEDILKQTGFSRQNASKYQEEMQRKETQQKRLNEWFEAAGSGAVGASLTHTFPPGLLDAGGCGDREKESIQQSEKDPEQLKPWLLKEMDSCISSIFLHEDQDAFSQLFNLILHERVSVDYTHSETGSTPLMASAARGFLPEMQQLLSMGADINMRACNGWTALDFAEHFQQTDAVDLLKTSIPLRQAEDREESTLIHCSPTELSSEAQELLRQYHHSFDDQQVDLDLIMTLLLNICTNTNEGAVLIFLPGYDEIVTLRDRIFSDDRMSTQSESYQVFTLHSDMQTLDQKRAMKPTPCGVRKIILSTNIAETSITIDDVVFVIDSGKVKEKSFDTLSRVSMLKSVWICKASVLQRKGRAGRCRPGICFHLFSRFHYKNMQEFQVPQLLRMPLQELCLQTKLLAPSSCPIADFLSKAPQPPPTHSIQSAVQMLKTIDALDQNEDLTDLGFHLADLPVESHLGKMVLCGVVLKCLDPILTIACSLAYRDPFTLPAESSQKRAALQSRMHFTASTFSDHMALLRAFQGWQKARSEGWNRSFCEKNFLSQSTMDMILGMRTQLLGQLRAIGFVRARGDSDIRDVNLNSENWAVVKAALVAGIYPNIVHVNRKASLLCSHREKKVLCHPTSVLSKLQLKENSSRLTQSLPTDWLIYDEMSRGHRVASVRCCSVVTAVTVAVFAGGTRPVTSTLYEPAGQKRNAADHLLNELSDSEPEDLAQMKIDDWLVFQLERENAALLCDLRQKWQELFIKRIRCPSKPWSQQDEAVIQTLVSVLGAEEHEAGLQQPAGVGQRPRPMSSEDGPRSSMRNSRTSPQAPAHSTNDRSKQLLFSDQMKTHSSDGVSKDRPPSSSTSSHSANPDGSDPMGPSSSGKPAPKPGLQRAMLSSVRYFIMKSNSMRNVEISQEKGIWSTTPSNESKLSQAFLANSLVLLVFSVQGSGHFQGYARMTSVVSQDSCQDWGLTGLGGLFSVEWIRKESLPFSRTQHILNPWNDNKRVQVSRDGQELEPQAGGQLLQLWEWTSGNH